MLSLLVTLVVISAVLGALGHVLGVPSTSGPRNAGKIDIGLVIATFIGVALIIIFLFFYPLLFIIVPLFTMFLLLFVLYIFYDRWRTYRKWEAEYEKEEERKEADKRLEEMVLDHLLNAHDKEEAKEVLRFMGGLPVEFLTSTRFPGGVGVSTFPGVRASTFRVAVKDAREKWGIECKDIPCVLLTLDVFNSCTCGSCCQLRFCRCAKSEVGDTA